MQWFITSVRNVFQPPRKSSWIACVRWKARSTGQYAFDKDNLMMKKTRFSMKYHFPVLKYCRKNLVIDNESQHSAVEKKRRRRRKRTRREFERRRTTTINYTKTRRKREREGTSMPSFRFLFHCSKLWQSNKDNTHIEKRRRRERERRSFRVDFKQQNIRWHSMSLFV